MIPNAKMDALENAPPENIFNRDIRPVLVCSCSLARASGLIPGRTTNEPNRYTAAKARVKRILVRKSSTLHMFLRVSINFFILNYCFTAEPPAAVIAASALLEKAFAVISTFAVRVPFPKTFTN